jgi:outer membrane protein OmpA-like peptidoglycan-associated protein
MNSTTKIALGALATTALAWFLNGPMHFGDKCGVSAPAVTAPATTESAVSSTPATAEAVADCQGKVNAVITGKNINFTSGGATIAPDSMVLIDALATELKACAGTSVEVAGHTDASGGDAPNQRLSEARANAVTQALVEKGVPTDRITPKGYGETAPLDPAGTSEAYAKNRRIEFKVAALAAPAAAVGQ